MECTLKKRDVRRTFRYVIVSSRAVTLIGLKATMYLPAIQRSQLSFLSVSFDDKKSVDMHTFYHVAGKQRKLIGVLFTFFLYFLHK